MSPTATGVPVIDISGLRGAGRSEIVGALARAHRTVGFSQILGHGIPGEALDALFDASRTFQALPLKERRQLALDHLHRGFIEIDTSVDRHSSIETATRPNQSESFMVMREAGPDDPEVVAGTLLAGPNQWPDLPGFRAAYDAYEPGSTFKVFTAAALLENGLVRTDSWFDCENRTWRYLGQTVEDHKSLGSLSFRDVIAEGELTSAEALAYARAIAEGLAEAHDKGVTHRDLKPENIYLVKRGEREVVKLLDFGIAKITRGSLENQEQITQNGRIMGTPRYFAPEQAQGLKIDNRSDLYSLGATLYRLLSGQKAFEGDKAKEVLRSVLQDEPEPLAPRVPGLPANVAALVMRMMAKDPADRPASAGVVVQQAEALLSGQAPTMPGVETEASAGTSRLLIAAAGIALAGGAAWFLLGGKDKTEPGGSPSTQAPGESPAEATPAREDETELSGVTPPTEPGVEDVAAPEEPEDDDSAERAFEDRASVALRVLESTDLPDSERIAALRAFASEWPGATAATRALEAAAALEQSLAAAEAVVDPMEAPRKALLEALVDGFAEERARFHELMADKAQNDEALAKGAEKARAVAADVLARVRERAGY